MAFGLVNSSEEFRRIISLFSDCVSHQEKQCFQCNYEKTCDGLNFKQRRFTDCDTMAITEYENLVASEIIKLQTKVTSVIDNALKTIEKKQTELMANIKLDPRKSPVDNMSLELELKIQHHSLIQKPPLNHAKSPQAEKRLLKRDSSRPGSLYNENAKFVPEKIKQSNWFFKKHFFTEIITLHRIHSLQFGSKGFSPNTRKRPLKMIFYRHF